MAFCLPLFGFLILFSFFSPLRHNIILSCTHEAFICVPSFRFNIYNNNILNVRVGCTRRISIVFYNTTLPENVESTMKVELLVACVIKISPFAREKLIFYHLLVFYPITYLVDLSKSCLFGVVVLPYYRARQTIDFNCGRGPPRK